MPETTPIVVLGCRVRDDGLPGSCLAARIRSAVALHRGRPRARLILSGGRRWSGRTEAEVMAAMAVELGVDPGLLVREEQSTTTLGNAVETLKLVGPGARVVVVTQGFHAARALRLFRGVGLEPAWEPAPTPAMPRWTRMRLAFGERLANTIDRLLPP